MSAIKILASGGAKENTSKPRNVNGNFGTSDLRRTTYPVKNEQKTKNPNKRRSNKTKTGKAHRKARAPVPFVERSGTHDPNSKDPSLVHCLLWEETRYVDPIRHPEPVHRQELSTRLEGHRAVILSPGISRRYYANLTIGGYAPPPNDQLLTEDLVLYLSTQAEAALGTGGR